MAGFISRFFERRRMEREGQIGTRKRRTESALGAAADQSRILTLALVLILWGVCVTVLTLPGMRDYPQLVANQQAPETIFAQVDFVYEDKSATEAERNAIRLQQPSYLLLQDEKTIAARRNLQQLCATIAERLKSERNTLPPEYLPTQISDKVANMSASAFKLLSQLHNNEILHRQFKNDFEKLLSTGIADPATLVTLSGDMPIRIFDSNGRNREGQQKFSSLVTVEQAAATLVKLLIADVPSNQLSSLDVEALGKLMVMIIGNSGNLELDDLRTSTRMEEAIASVSPVLIEVKRNEIIIPRNALVTPKVLDALAAQEAVLKMHDTDNNHFQLLLHNAFWSLTLILFAGFYLVHIHPEITRSSRRIAMIVTICAMSLGINYLAMELFYFFSGLLAIPPDLLPDALPLALPAVLLTVMAGYRVSLYVGFFVAMTSALMLGGSYNVALEGFVLSALCGLIVRPSSNHRSFFLRAFLCTFFAVWLLDFNLYWHITSAPLMLIYSLAMAAANALFTAIAAMLLTFLFELLFNVSTNMSLMVLCDYNHPLLKELHLRAPGTSLHSQNVAVLAENAALEIDANAILARAGALFHDIGKVKNPEYFIENNQSSTNPHNRLNPRMSSLIISNHVKDGMDMALQYKLCRKVRQFIQQHHGTDLIAFFYHQALAGKDPVLESDYRYPGPRPHEKEVVIVSLADACEAACRSLEKPTASKIEAMVNEIFRKRWREGQLDDADLTVGELSLINESFVHTLTTMYHSRIAYPKDENTNEDNVLVSERPAAGAEPKAPAPGNE